MPGRKWIVLAVLFATRAAIGFQFQSIGSAANLLMADLGIGYSEVGMLLGAYMLPGVLVAFPAGLLGGGGREKTLGIVGLVLMAVSGLALVYSGDLVFALAARTVGGVGGTIVGLVATKMVADWFDAREMVLAMSILQMSWPFGAMIALPIQTWIAHSLGWQAVMASGAICSVAALLAFAMIPRAAQSIQAEAAGPGRLPRAALIPVVISGAIWGAMNLACVLFFSYAPLLMVAQGSSPTVAASLTSLSIWFTIIAIPAGGYLVHRAGRPITAIIACSLIAACALLLFVENFHSTIACLIFGVAIGPMSGAILSMPARVLEPADRSMGFGLFYTCFYVLMAAGPTAAGSLQDAWGSPSAALVASAVLLASMVPLVLLFLVVAKRCEFAQPSPEAKLRAAS
ncbi:MFS transporter [Bradyrhizobium sp. JYMT SZCCT0180]|uniref:MFS transporter n=1 Tax=Bradyrhizobium sp. JYMT SZCCT0180 TaxID=2807666 RepID=UPI001BA6D354|nr:MFS transporter [Bradyrhizobium sp. JYMT SZCCT0180]MBR1213711.1 MFS transporter [Bradyrhizobium sp. JYMT SZCCT0180]